MSRSETSGRGLNRRQFLPRAAAGTVGLAIAGLVGYEVHPSTADSSPAPSASDPATVSTETSATTTTPSSAEVQSFITRPDLSPPTVKVTRPAGNPTDDTELPYIMLAANNVVPGGVVQQGLMIVDRQGRLVYFKPLAEKPFDFNAQSDRGKSVLTWWQGRLVSSHGAGTGVCIDAHYRPVQQIRAGHGLSTDLHELNLTSRGTALITAYEETSTSLSSIGGPARHQVFAGHAQEIDLKTGKILFDWNSLDHIGVDESYEVLPAGSSEVLDYLHINSVSETSDGNLLISGRNTHTLYKVDRSSGEVLWRLNGKKSDFDVAADAQFNWQHHSRAWSDTQYTVFDNGRTIPGSRSRALLLNVDESAKQVTLTRAYEHPAAFLAATLGSVTLLPNGHVFVGWGAQPYFSEFAADGTLVFDGQLPINVRSYRAFATDWSGRPTDKPAVVARVNPAGGFVVRVSWNGATDVARWNILAGAQASSMTVVGSQEWSGFETAVVINSEGPAFQAVALDANGDELGRSEVV